MKEERFSLDELKKPKNIFYMSVIAVALIVMAVLLIKFKNTTGQGAEAGLLATTEVSKNKEEKVLVTINVDTIQDGLENMGVLITQEYYFTQVETYTKDKKVLGFIDSSSGFTYSYDGKVTAGIDFGEITVSKDEENKKLTIEIPASQIQSVDIDSRTFQVYSEKDSLWNPLNIEDYNLSLTEFEDTARKKAYDSGILDRSDEQAKELIKNFVSNFPNTSEYEIEIVQRRSTNES